MLICLDRVSALADHASRYLWSVSQEELMPPTVEPKERASKAAVGETRKVEIRRKVASRLTEGTVRVQRNQFLTERNLSERRARILSYDLDK